MIDPDHTDLDKNYFSNHPNSRVFIIQQNYLANIFVHHDGTNLKLEYLWSILKRSDGVPWLFWLDKKYLNKETFLDELKEKYPDHFEWLIWNSEWLS